MIRMFIRLDKTRVRDGQTDGRIDRIALASTALCIANHADALSQIYL